MGLGAGDAQTGQGRLAPLDATGTPSVVRYGRRAEQLDQEARGLAEVSTPGGAHRMALHASQM